MTQAQARGRVHRSDQRPDFADVGLEAMRTGEVSGDAGIAGGGPKGSTRANSYNVTDKGDRVVLNGRVRTRLEPRR